MTLILESSLWCVPVLLCCLVMPSSSFTLSSLTPLLFLLWALCGSCCSLTVVSLCGLSEECFDQCQLNSHVLYDTHCAAVYSKMWSSIYIRMHADFKLDVPPKRFCEDYSCRLHIKARFWPLNEVRSVALRSPWEATLFGINWWH